MSARVISSCLFFLLVPVSPAISTNQAVPASPAASTNQEALICENYNMTRCKGSEAECTTPEDCPAVPEGRSHCYALWRYDDVTNTSNIIRKGCGHSYNSGCHRQECIDGVKRRQHKHYCCCASDMCNQNFTIKVKPPAVIVHEYTRADQLSQIDEQVAKTIAHWKIYEYILKATESKYRTRYIVERTSLLIIVVVVMAIMIMLMLPNRRSTLPMLAARSRPKVDRRARLGVRHERLF